jgi:hypothetical protein
LWITFNPSRLFLRSLGTIPGSEANGAGVVPLRSDH